MEEYLAGPVLCFLPIIKYKIGPKKGRRMITSTHMSFVVVSVKLDLSALISAITINTGSRNRKIVHKISVMSGSRSSMFIFLN